MSIPEQIPAELIAGDTWRWMRELPGYPAPTWTLTVYFENKDATFSAGGVASGAVHSFTIAAATTATYSPGRYQWRVRATDGSVVETIESGWLQVRPDPAAAGPTDVRSWARRTLEAIEAFLEGNATTAQASMSIQGRSVSRWSLAELNQFRKELRQEVRIEEHGQKAGHGRNVKVRFGRG